VHSLSEAEPIKIAGFDTTFANFADRKHYAEWVFTTEPMTIENR
jgi:hypothetical protein